MTIRFITLEQLEDELQLELFIQFMESIGAFDIQFPKILDMSEPLVTVLIYVPDGQPVRAIKTRAGFLRAYTEKVNIGLQPAEKNKVNNNNFIVYLTFPEKSGNVSLYLSRIMI